jgi:sugar phosphate isomerase/epimerase
MTHDNTIQAHNRKWPLHAREAFSVSVVGYIERDTIDAANQVAEELRAVLDKYGVEVEVGPLTTMFMSPEDEAEKNALDELALRG